MSEMNLDEERKFCKKVYEKFDFVRTIVELYAEGVSWQGCNKFDDEAIKSGVRDMLVNGVGQFSVGTESGIQVPMPPKFAFAGEEPGHPFLWPVTQNAEQLGRMQDMLPNSGALENFKMLAKDMCLGLGVPLEFLGSLATTANGDAIMQGLTTFVGNVNTWRERLIYSLEISWNETWLTSELTSYGQVYQVFKAQGIELKTLREQALNSTKAALDSNLLPRQTVEEWVKWF